MRQFSKPAITVSEQLAFLKARGLQINDEARATLFLEAVSFFPPNALYAAFPNL